ncbi:unnamed protein product [Protopolystoma xenopodis]|uniref:Uncharacterized protein n=1 Tax=Protopolystoma xenopodis TaxID=117903 RepID=A0A3S5AI00_9PLAT|nr:unnamed protein product [Protopolystoma xenopodis]
MVYLAREESSSADSVGEVQWALDLSNTGYEVAKVHTDFAGFSGFDFTYELYEFMYSQLYTWTKLYGLPS